MEALLDSNFIISCFKRKIDFISQLKQQGFKPILPIEVFQELKDLRFKLSHEDKIAVDIALKFFENSKIKKMKLGNRSVDGGLIEKGKQGYYIATLDNAIRRVIPNKIVISSAQNSLQVERR
ncbi:MAG: hypothetical protein AABW65_02380 [Nanoarchaeota archaeon]